MYEWHDHLVVSGKKSENKLLYYWMMKPYTFWNSQTCLLSTDLWLKMKRLLLHSLLGIWLWAFLWVGVGFEKTKQIKIYQLSELASVLFIASFITLFPPKIIDQTFLNFDLLYTFLRSLQPTSLLFFIMDIILHILMCKFLCFLTTQQEMALKLFSMDNL